MTATLCHKVHLINRLYIKFSVRELQKLIEDQVGFQQVAESCALNRWNQLQGLAAMRE